MAEWRNFKIGQLIVKLKILTSDKHCRGSFSMLHFHYRYHYLTNTKSYERWIDGNIQTPNVVKRQLLWRSSSSNNNLNGTLVVLLLRNNTDQCIYLTICQLLLYQSYRTWAKGGKLCHCQCNRDCNDMVVSWEAGKKSY